MAGGELLVSATNEEEALEEVLNRLGVDREAIDYEVSTESEEDLLPGATPEVEVRAWIRPEWMAERAQTVLERMLELMEFEHTIDVSIRDRLITLDLTAPNHASVLIGRNGQTLEALQYLINRMILRSGREAPMIFVDVEGYRRRDYKELEELVELAVKRARETGNEMELDPMYPATRKYLHHYLQRFDGVSTFSRGEEPDRYLVIIAE